MVRAALAGVTVLGLAWLSSGYLLEWLAGAYMPDSVGVKDIRLTMRGTLLIGHIQVADERGVWAEVSGLRVDPAWRRLIRGVRALNRMDAEAVQIHRRPVSKMPFRVPLIPGWHALPICGQVQIGQLNLEKPVAGYPAAYRATGRLDRDDGRVSVSLSLTDDTGRRLSLTITDAVCPGGPPDRSEVTLDFEGLDGQVLPRWLDTVEPVAVRLSGSGQREQWTAEVSLSAGSSSAIWRLAAEGYETVQYVLEGTIQGRMGGLPGRLAGSGTIGVALRTTLDAAGTMHIAEATAASDRVSLSATGTLHTSDWTGEGEGTVTTADLQRFLEQLADVAAATDSPSGRAPVSAKFSGRISRQQDYFRVEGAGSVGDTPLLTLRLERSRDDMLRGEGRMDLDRVPLPETWRSLMGGGEWVFAASGGGDEAGWRVDKISLTSPVWRIEGAAGGTGSNLETVQLEGQLTCATADTRTPWGRLESAEGRVRFSGHPDAITIHAEATCAHWTGSSMSLDGITAELSGVLNLRGGRWADGVQRLDASASAQAWTFRNTLPAPACRMTLSRLDDATLQLSGKVETPDLGIAELSGTWQPETGALDLNGHVRVNLTHTSAWVPAAQDYHPGGSVSVSLHAVRPGGGAPLLLNFAAEGTDLEADWGNAFLQALLPAVDRRLTCEGELEIAEQAINGGMRLRAPSGNLQMAEVSLQVERTRQNWILGIGSQVMPTISEWLISPIPEVPRWLFRGNGMLRLEVRGTGMAPEEIAGVYSWAAGTDDTLLQAAATGVRLRRNGPVWEGSACLLAHPVNLPHPLGLTGTVALGDSLAELRRVRMGVASAGWWRLRDQLALTDHPAFSRDFGEGEAKLSAGKVSGTMRLRDAAIPAVLHQAERGALSGEIGLEHTRGTTRVTADVKVQDLGVGGLQVDVGNGTLVWERGGNGSSRWRGRVEVTSGKAGSAVRLEKQVLTLETPDEAGGAQWTFSGRLAAGAVPAEYGLEGGVDSAFTMLTIAGGQGHVAHQSWRLAAPAVTRRDPEGLRLESARVEIGAGGYLEGEGQWRQGTLSGRLSWEQLSLSALGPVTDWTGLEGVCGGRTEFSGPLNDIQGHVDLVVEARPAGYGSDGTGLTATLVLSRESGGLTAWKGEMTGRGLEQPLRAEIEGRGFSRFGLQPLVIELIPDAEFLSRATFSGNLGYAGLFTGQDQFSLGGSITGAINWKRSSGTPDIAGQIALKDGYYEDYRFGTVLRGITCDARTEGPTVRVTHFSAEDGRDGTLEGGGILKGGSSLWPDMNLRIVLNRLRVLRMDYAAAMVSGELNLTGPITGPQISGSLTLDQGVIEVAMAAPAGRDQEITVTVERPDDVSPSGAADRDTGAAVNIAGHRGQKPNRRSRIWAGARCDLALEIPGRLQIRAPILQSEWQGRIEASGMLQDVRCRGGLEIIRGTLNFFGRRLDLADSRVTMNQQDLYRPHLALRVSGDSGDTAVRLALEGEPGNMELTVLSTPPLPPEEALSRLLFRRGPAQVSPLQALQVARAASLLGRQFTLLQFLSGNFRIPGVDAFDIRTGDTLADTAVGVGRSIGDRVYVQAEQGLTSSSGRVSAEMEVTPHVRVKVDAGANEGGGGGIFWKREY